MTLIVIATIAAIIGGANVPTPDDPVPVFEAWTAEQGTPVAQAACRTDQATSGAAITCYGLTGSLTEGFDAVVVAIGITEGDGITFALLPFGVPSTSASAPAAGPGTTFGDGTWIVGTDVAPGAYRAPGGSLCYWARLADFSGEDIIVNEFSDTSSQVLVEIAHTDVAFESSGCGTWEPI